MPSERSSDVKLEIGHVLFIDIVGYSKLLITEQTEQIQKLKEIVRETEQVRLAEVEGKLLRLPTGDGGALVFRNNPEASVLCALEIATALKNHPELHVRMGVHSGPVNEVADLNEQANIAGAGINLAQRVMDCGDAGHILLSKHVAEDLEHYPRWQPYLHSLGECEVKHDVRVGVVNFYRDGLGNAQLPKKFRQVQKRRAWVRWGIAAAAALLLAATTAAFLIVSQRPAQLPHDIPEKSIAVLPFENLSSDKENAYFANGIQDEILTRLSKIAALKVISRTSTQKYKSAPDNLREVGSQLGVANLLEGSVQKAGNAVHINVQLIKAATDAQLWAESYDRELQNIFGVEGEVAGAVADALQANLTGSEKAQLASKPTQNAAAYDAYLRGVSIEHTQLGFDGDKNAAKAYAQAIQLDPRFALAWASLAIIRSPLYLYGVDPKTNSAEAIREAADKAMALQPELAEAWAAQGAYRYRVARDFSGALQAYEEAHKRFPNGSRILMEMAVVETRLGSWDKAEDRWRKAMELDPRNSTLLATVAREFLSRLRRFSEAQVLLDRALQLSPGDNWIHTARSSMLLYAGQLDDAARELALLPADSTADPIVGARFDHLTWTRQFNPAVNLLERKISSLTQGEPLDEWTKIFITDLGYCQEWAGKPEEAKGTFTRAVHEIKPTTDLVVAPKGFGIRMYLALAYAGLGEKEQALEQAHRAVEEYADDGWVKPGAEAALAQIQARFGDIDAAVAAIPHLLEVPAGITLADLKFNPFWDPLRMDPRFEKLCQEKQR